MKNPVSASLAGLLELRQKTRSLPPLRSDERLDGRVALVTGANRGLGKAVAQQLAERGARVIMACRSGIPEAGEEIKRLSRSDAVEMRPLDLADLRSVRRLCEELARDGVRVDVLVLNAGVVPQEARPSAQGLELQFAVNYLANVALVEEALAQGVVRPTAQGHKPRLVFVSSETHRNAGPVDLAGLGKFRPYGAMGSLEVYGYTKLLLTVYAAALARRLGAGASVSSMCPGAVNTDIAREAPAWVQPFLGRVMDKFFLSPKDAAEPVVYLCCAEALEQRTGHYLHRMREKPADPAAADVRLGTELTHATAALIARALKESP